MQWAKAAEVFAIVLVPVALGMVVRHFWPRFATTGWTSRCASHRSSSSSSSSRGAVASNWALLRRRTSRRLALITIVFCVISLTIGYLVPRLFKVGKRQAIASSFEIGIHNATLAIVIAQSVLGSIELSLPAAVYGVLMFFIAFGFGFLIRDREGGCRRDASRTSRSRSPTACLTHGARCGARAGAVRRLCADGEEVRCAS